MKQSRQKSKKTGMWGRGLLLPVLMLILLVSGCAKEEEPQIQISTVELPEGTGFAQGIFLPYGITVDDAAEGKRNGGFGSTTK